MRCGEIGEVVVVVLGKGEIDGILLPSFEKEGCEAMSQSQLSTCLTNSLACKEEERRGESTIFTREALHLDNN